MVSLSLTTSGIVDTTQIDASDVLTPVNELKVHLENTLNGVQNFDQLKFTDATELTIASGAITISQSYHKIDTEANAASDDLDTISGGALGDILFLRAEDAGRTFNIRHIGGGTGNLRTADGSAIVFDEIYKVAMLLNYDGSNWFAMAFPLNIVNLAEKTIPAGDDVLVIEDSAASYAKKKLLVSNVLPMAIMRDEKASGTAGGTSANATWNNRNLNTKTYDPLSIVTVSSNQFTPIAGDYILRARAAAGATAAAPLHRLRLFNVTGAVSVEEGLNAAGALTAGIRSMAELECAFTANGTDAYRIDHYTSTGLATNGLGLAVNDGSPEVYLEVVLTKVG
jgi:hypothetical protein